MIWPKKCLPSTMVGEQRKFLILQPLKRLFQCLKSPPTLTKFQNNIDIALRRKGGVKTEILNRKIFLAISYIIYNYMFIYVSTSSAGH